MNVDGPRRAVFLDRDGVINRRRDDYVKRWDEFEFLPGALPALRRLAESDFLIVVATNQSAVGRGRTSLEAIEEIHRNMATEVHDLGGRIDAVYYCPHAPDAGCSCRKPKPGLLERAARDLGIELPSSYLIGDQQTDMYAALAAGCRAVLIREMPAARPMNGAEPEGWFSQADSLAAAIEQIMTKEAVP